MLIRVSRSPTRRPQMSRLSATQILSVHVVEDKRNQKIFTFQRGNLENFDLWCQTNTDGLTLFCSADPSSSSSSSSSSSHSACSELLVTAGLNVYHTLKTCCFILLSPQILWRRCWKCLQTIDWLSALFLHSETGRRCTAVALSAHFLSWITLST